MKINIVGAGISGLATAQALLTRDPQAEITIFESGQRTGGKVIGYFCTYVPEEILHAAGVLPVRILGSHEPQDVTEPHIFGMYCPFCRDCLAQGLQGRYDYLDGIMIRTFSHAVAEEMARASSVPGWVEQRRRWTFTT